MIIKVRVRSLRGSGIIEDHVVKISPQKKYDLSDFMTAARKLDPNPKGSSPEGVSGGENGFARQMNHAKALKALQANIGEIDEIFSLFLDKNPEKRLDVGRVQTLIRDRNLVSRSLIIDASDLRKILSWLNEYNPGKWTGRQMGLEAQARLEYTPEPIEEYESEVTTEDTSQLPKESLFDKYFFNELPRIITLYRKIISIQKVRVVRLSKSQSRKLEIAKEKTHLLELEMLLRNAEMRQRILQEVLGDMS